MVTRIPPGVCLALNCASAAAVLLQLYKGTRLMVKDHTDPRRDDTVAVPGFERPCAEGNRLALEWRSILADSLSLKGTSS